MNTKQAKKHLAAIAAKQRSHSQYIQRCPRCGCPQRKTESWKVSTQEQVLICPACEKDERNRVEKEDILPLNQWHVFRILDKAGNLPCRPGLRAIDLELQDEPNVVQATFECWFDVEAKFDIDFSPYPEDTWINLYANYNVLTGQLTMFYTIDDNDKMETFLYVPTARERRSVISNMEDECMEKENCTMAGLVHSLAENTPANKTVNAIYSPNSELGGFVKNIETGKYEIMFTTEIGSVQLTHNRAVEAAANKNRFGGRRYDLDDVIVMHRHQVTSVSQWVKVEGE